MMNLERVIEAFTHALNVLIKEENYELCTPVQKLINETKILKDGADSITK